jgi:energy-coupling factor transport system permease protein
VTPARRIPRALNPVAWWIWALGLLIAASRTTNPLLLLLTLAVLAFVVANRRTEAPWARAFKYYLRLALIVIVIRIVFQSVFATGGPQPGSHILFTLPTIHTPHWYAGIQIGGAVTLEGTLTAITGGLRLGTMICCVGAANALANPKRALRVLPGALYELGTAVVVSITLAPQMIESVQRVARARRLRGGKRSGWRALRSIAIPVLADALDRSLLLAAAMDSRGYGRTGTATRQARQLNAALMLLGMFGLCVGCYGLLAGSGPRYLGLPALLLGAALCCGGITLGGRRVHRSQYRPDPWLAPEWIVAACGIVSAVALYLTTSYNAADLNPSFYPLAFPALPALPAAAILLASIPAFAAPPPP